MKKDEHLIIKLFLVIYACALFALSVFIPVFDSKISESAKFGLYFLQDASFAWVSAMFAYFFGKTVFEFLKRVTPSLFKPDETLKDK